MTDALMVMTHFAALACAILVAPWLCARLVCPRASFTGTLALWGCATVFLNPAVAVSLHLAGVPITADSLTLAHIPLTAMLIVVATFLRRRPIPATRAPDALMGIPLLGFALAVIPWTHLTGIDTYKWQVLAKSVRVEQAILWLVHPASLLGFTPRAYPSAQPLTLATIEILGHTSVEAGFYLFSLISGFTGIAAMGILARRLAPASPGVAVWAAFLYGFSPVFMRYSHWATGRGLFLALFPLFLVALVEFPRRRALLALLPLGALLAFAHKVGLFAVPLGLLSLLVSPCVPRLRRPLPALLLATPSLAAAIALSGGSSFSPYAMLSGFGYACVTRFGWYLPAAALALLIAPATLFTSPFRRLAAAAFLSFPLAFHSEMYGALLALPFVSLMATAAVAALARHFPHRRAGIAAVAIALALIAATSILARRTADAMPARIRQAARFLDHYDPKGPFDLVAPGRARVQIHAYVSGCPRFTVQPRGTAALAVRTPPPFRGPLPEWASAWVDFGRNLLELSETDVEWYGANPRLYYITVDGEGDRPRDAEEIYSSDGVSIYRPASQPPPPEESS